MGESALDLFRVDPEAKRFDLADLRAGDTRGVSPRRVARGDSYGRKLLALQERLYAEASRAILIVLQGVDTSGKDGTVRRVMTGMNPQGVDVRSFKVPSAREQRHHFFSRFKSQLPTPGRIMIFNRSHYEDVLIARVKSLAAPEVIEARYAQINRFEADLGRRSIKVVKIFLHISFGEQRRRLLDRLRVPEKRWKFSPNDLSERSRWNGYQEAYAIALGRCSTVTAPWYAVPANHREFRDWAVSRILLETLRSMAPAVRMPPLGTRELERRLRATRRDQDPPQ